MVPLKENGGLDIERINKLPLVQYLTYIRAFTKSQLEEFLSKTPPNESYEPMEPIQVDFGFEDKRSGVDIDAYLATKKKRYQL